MRPPVPHWPCKMLVWPWDRTFTGWIALRKADAAVTRTTASSSLLASAEPPPSTGNASLHNSPSLADPVGDLYTALGFSRGALPDAPLSPYAKLLLMLAGIESPGTIQVSWLCAGACWALLLGTVGQLAGRHWPLVQRRAFSGW